MNCDHLDKFEEKHVISILMYVAGNPGCKKTDIYDAVSRNPRMPEKIEILESMGLMTHETVNRSSFYKLTAGGINIARLLSAVSNEISNMDSAARTGNGATARSRRNDRCHEQRSKPVTSTGRETGTVRRPPCPILCFRDVRHASIPKRRKIGAGAPV